MDWIDKFCSKIGLKDKRIESGDEEFPEDYQDEDSEEYDEEDEPVSKYERPFREEGASARNVVDFSSVQKEKADAVKMRVVVIEPKSFDDAQQVANCLREKRPVVINVENTDSDDARRIIDFISGTTYALNGEIKKVGHDVFFCAPSNVNVSLTQEDRRVSTEMPWLNKDKE
jgi:cell division inhibitor SepF